MERETDEGDAFVLELEQGANSIIQIQMDKISRRNLLRGYGSNVTLNITYSVGVWYLELTDASSRKVTAAHEELGRALEEIFQ